MICVDASLVVRALTDEEGNERAARLFESWRRSGTPLVAPALLHYEVAAALCRKVSASDLRESEAVQAYRLSLTLGIEVRHDPNLLTRAILLARSFGFKTPYDFVYLILAEEEGADLFTADRNFVETVKEGYPFVRYYWDALS